MRVLERAQLAHQRVEFDVGDFRIVLTVVPRLVMADERPKFEDAGRVRHDSFVLRQCRTNCDARTVRAEHVETNRD